MSEIVQFLSELKRVDVQISRIESETEGLKKSLKKAGLEILQKFRENAEAIIEETLSEIEEDIEKKSIDENKKIIEDEKNKLFQLRDKAQQRMDELVEAALRLTLDSD
ncbi:MAG: hypothetical protein V1850_06780 [Candidatus Bathyarchaeota archaeon]